MSKNTKKLLILTPAEETKVRSGLNLIQAAQNAINVAAQELCSVRGFADEWSASSEPYNAVKTYWHLVDSRRQAIKDGEVKE